MAYRSELSGTDQLVHKCRVHPLMVKDLSSMIAKPLTQVLDLQISDPSSHDQ